MKHATCLRTPRGVTLVELVVVLTILGVVGSIGATLMGRLVTGQQEQRARLVLASAADSALARLLDDVQGALPNSVRLVTSGAGATAEFWLEWVPVLDAGRWRAAADTVSASAGDSLDLADAADSSFDVIGPALAPAAAGNELVLGNLGTPEADVYNGSSRRTGLVLGNGGRSVAFTAAGLLPQTVQGQRFFIVGTPMTLSCRPDGAGAFVLRRYTGYGWLASQPADAAHPALASANTNLVLTDLNECAASYSTALANIGLLNLRLGLGAAPAAGNGARLLLMQQASIDNTP